MKYTLVLFLFLIIQNLSAQNDTVFCTSGLKYVRIKEGDGKKALPGQRIKVTFSGKLTNGEVFQALEKGDSFMFTIGDKDIIAGWNEGFALMSAGEKGILIIPPFLGYGAKGAKDPFGEKEYLVPPNSTLIFEVELISIKK